jgi:hypothetical protein
MAMINAARFITGIISERSGRSRSSHWFPPGEHRRKNSGRALKLCSDNLVGAGPISFR